MDLRQYARVLRAQWLLIVTAVILTSVAAAAHAWTRTPIYSAQVQLFISARVPADLSEIYQGVLFSQQRVRSYAQLVSGPAVAERVIDRLDLPETVEAMQGKIDVAVPPDTVLIDVAVRDPSPERAKLLADTVGAEFSAFINDLEGSPEAERSPVEVGVTSPARVPTSPISPRKMLSLVLGAHLGLLIGIVAAAFREAVTRPVRRPVDAETIVRAPVLGTVVDFVGVDSRVVIHNPASPEAEGYRRLRTALQALGGGAEQRCCVVTSAAPSDGKTSVLVNLGIAFAQSGHSVTLVDGNLRRPGLGEALDLVPLAGGLTDVLLDGVGVDRAVQRWRSGLNLDVLLAGRPVPDSSEILGSRRFYETLETLSRRSNLVLVDAPGLLSANDAAVLARVTSGAIIVAQQDVTRADELAEGVEALWAADARVLGVVLAQRRRRRKASSADRDAWDERAHVAGEAAMRPARSGERVA